MLLWQDSPYAIYCEADGYLRAPRTFQRVDHAHRVPVLPVPGKASTHGNDSF